MNVNPYKYLVWILGLLSLVLLSLLGYSHFRYIEFRGEVRYANDIIWTFEQERDAAYKGTEKDAADALWRLHFPSFQWPGQPEPFHGIVARLVERERRGRVRDVIYRLKSQTGEDLGNDPEPWILKYGSENSKADLISMKEYDAERTTVQRSKAVQRTGASRLEQETNRTSSAAGP